MSKVVSNTELLVTTPAHASSMVDVVLSRAGQRDVGYGAYTYDKNSPSGNPKDSVQKLTPMQPVCNKATASQAYRVDRAGHGSNAGSLAGVILSVKTASPYGSMQLLARDGGLVRTRTSNRMPHAHG